jgi:hypothetical protein
MRSGEVDSATRTAVEEHLAGCADCKARLAPATLAMPSSAAVQAVLFPEEIAGVPRGWVYTVVSLGSATLALSIAVVYLMAQPATASATGESARDERRPAREAPVAEALVEREPASAEPARIELAAAPEAPTPAPASATAAPAPAPSSAASVEPSAARDSSAPKARAKAGGETSAPAPAASAPAATAAAPDPPKAAAPEAPAAQAPPKPKDEIEKLLFEAAGPAVEAPPVKEDKSGDEATGLTRSQVMDVMNSLQDKVHECAVQTGKSGTVQVTATVVQTGRVKSVRIAGMFAGTPAGDCVATVVRGAVFPTFVGQPQPVNYPVPLR